MSLRFGEFSLDEGRRLIHRGEERGHVSREALGSGSARCS